MLTLIKGGRIIDPGNLDIAGDILIEDSKIVSIVNPDGKDSLDGGGSVPSNTHKNVGSVPEPDRIINASGMVVTPGLIDMHVHLREPGFEYKETIESGCSAAAHGGFTTVCCMPNTNPVNDNGQISEFIIKKALIADTVRVLPVGAISKGLQGENLCEYGELKEAGVVAVSDDGQPVMNSLLMRRAMEYAKGFGLLVISHCEDLNLASNGMMNGGKVAAELGLRGIPNAVETIMVMRDISLSEYTGIPIHIAHVSTKESVNAIRTAKRNGVCVTAETAPHYFILTHEAVRGYNTNAKMNPPLRDEQDKAAIEEGLADGTIDVIATDHAPHSDLEKDVEFDKAANGIIGLETSLSLGLTLVKNKVLTLPRLIEKMSKNPARILGIENGIHIGAPADITIIDTEKTYTVNADTFKSKSRNTPFNGWSLTGKAVLTMVGGKIVFTENGFN